MKPEKKMNAVTRFLILSFSGLIIFSSLSFVMLGTYMTRKSHEAFHQIGNIYMSGTCEQISRHFESVIKLRFEQANGLVSVVSSDIGNTEDLYQELIYRADVRGFDYLALCSVDGEFETLKGTPIQPLNPGPFVDALVQGKQRVAIGINSAGEKVVLFGVDADYPMSSGEKCTGLIVAVPLDYITDFLSLEKEDQNMYFCIIRSDGSIVLNNFQIGLEESKRFPEQLDCDANMKLGYSSEAFSEALQNRQTYASTVELNGQEQKIHSIPLANSEWNLISIMPYNALNDVMDTLNVQRTQTTVVCCLSVLILMLLIFAAYFRMTNSQVKALEKSRQEATKANRAKSEFLANMSHDIRTPMNSIVGMTAIATAHIDDLDRVKECLRKITLSSRQLLGLINDILDMSKIESGKMTLAIENTSLKDLFDGVVSIIQPQINTKNQSFEVHVQDVTTEDVWCDGVRLNQVLLNLLSNATKYTPAGGKIQLSVFEEASPKGEKYARMHIYVKDNGIGMTPEFLEKIFDSYSRADAARVQRIEGAGLGMAITKCIVDAMEGTIDVQSQLGEGTEFHVTLDMEKAPATKEDLVLPPWKMLVADDDEFLCRTTIDMLKTMGISADWTLSGEKAVELALRQHEKNDDYQIILLDWKLPGMDGVQTAKALRQKLGDEVPILLISAYDWSDFETEAREAGVNGFIPKPLFKTTLYHSLRQYADTEEESAQTEKQGSDFSGHRVLLAEDNELNWEVASVLLSDLGLELDWAEDGLICLEKFKKAPAGYYDMILMDIRMPQMTGYEATQAIRNLDRPDAATIPIIAMSADAFSEDIQRSLDSGMNGHIAKPIDVGAITKILQHYLKEAPDGE